MVTISLMVLLMIIGVGLLGMAAITIRGSRVGNARAEAQANARLAVVMALGQLQQTLGPDRRISATATAIHPSAAQPDLVGVWDSWRWEPTLDGSPDYDQKKDLFRSWLCSGSNPAAVESNEFALAAPSTDSVVLVDPPADTPDNLPLRAQLLPTGNAGNPGAMAWASFDESVKAPLHLVDDGRTSIEAGIARRQAAPRARPDMLSDALASITEPARAITLQTAALQTGGRSDEIDSRLHDLSTSGLGVLADAASGGLRTDLSTTLESSLNPANTLGSPTPYLDGQDSAPNWNYLRDHYQLYQKVVDSDKGEPQVRLTSRDLRPTSRGRIPSPSTENLMPVIAKMQIIFSIVAHYNHIPERINFYDQHGVPKGNRNYAAPHLVYDPVITLYNPYDVALRLDKLRIRVWDPPVGFRFRKNGIYLRPEFDRGEWHSLARFQIANEHNDNAEKSFTLLLTDSRRNRPGAPILLQPGEVKVFSPWVESNWTWGFETRSAWDPRSFFDWRAGDDFANHDPRTNNMFGVETVPGWDVRAGLQTDHLSYSGGARPRSTYYDFELRNNWSNHGWLCIKLDETFTVEASPTVTRRDSSRRADFRVDLLAAARTEVDRDLLRSFEFKFTDVGPEISETAEVPVIERTFTIAHLLQEPDDPSPGGKTPFAVLTMGAKTTLDYDDNSKPWLFNNPVIEGSWQSSLEQGWAHQSNDLSFREVQDFTTFPGVEIDPDSNRGFFGASSTADRGVSNVPMHRVPVQPATSLGDWINANLLSGSEQPHFTQPFGNSFAHPLLPGEAISTGGSPALLDHSYLLNDALWDRYYFSSITPQGGAGIDSRKELIESVMSGTSRLPNHRLVPAPAGGHPPAELAADLDALPEDQLARRLSAHLMIEAPFNVNSTSTEAWRALLMSMRDQAVLGWARHEFDSEERSSLPRASLPIAGDGADLDDTASLDLRGAVRWAGYRSLDDEQIEQLAANIVGEIQERSQLDAAPSLSLGEFVNRRVASSPPHQLAGILQTAIDKLALNQEAHDLDSQEIDPAALPRTETLGMQNEEALAGFTGEGAPSMLTQGDLLRPLAPILTVRGDTFKIRAYGESRNQDGKVIATAWCEATAQRLPGFLDPVDPPETVEDQLESTDNLRFGRRFILTSFRWLSKDEL